MIFVYSFGHVWHDFYDILKGFFSRYWCQFKFSFKGFEPEIFMSINLKENLNKNDFRLSQEAWKIRKTIKRNHKNSKWNIYSIRKGCKNILHKWQIKTKEIPLMSLLLNSWSKKHKSWFVFIPDEQPNDSEWFKFEPQCRQNFRRQ